MEDTNSKGFAKNIGSKSDISRGNVLKTSETIPARKFGTFGEAKQRYSKIMESLIYKRGAWGTSVCVCGGGGGGGHNA